MNIKILPAARDDLINGFYFYEHIEEGVGRYFLDSLFADIDSLLIYHGVHQIYFKKYFRLLAKHFPFAVYYLVENKNIIVYAVLDCRKNPAWLEGRFK